MNLLEYLQPQANDAAVSATNAALDTASARPYNVVLSVDEGTRIWIAGLLLVAGVLHLFRK